MQTSCVARRAIVLERNLSIDGGPGNNRAPLSGTPQTSVGGACTTGDWPFTRHGQVEVGRQLVAAE